MRGGTVGIRCAGNDGSLAYATPDDGYSVAVLDRGPDEVHVQFVQGSWTTDFQATCQDGQPHTVVNGTSGSH